MSRIDHDESIAQRLLGIDDRRPPNLEHQVVAVPPRSVAPHRPAQPEVEHHLVGAVLQPIDTVDQRVRSAIAYPIGIAVGAVEPHPDGRVALVYPERYPPVHGDTDPDPVRLWSHGQKAHPRARPGRAARQWAGLVLWNPRVGVLGQLQTQGAVDAAGHGGASAAGEEPMERGPGRGTPDGDAVGAASAIGVIVQLHHYRWPFDHRQLDGPTDPSSVGTADRFDDGRRRRRGWGRVDAPPAANNRPRMGPDRPWQEHPHVARLVQTLVEPGGLASEGADAPRNGCRGVIGYQWNHRSVLEDDAYRSARRSSH